jgi:hypothetical protein
MFTCLYIKVVLGVVAAAQRMRVAWVTAFCVENAATHSERTSHWHLSLNV